MVRVPTVRSPCGWGVQRLEGFPMVRGPHGWSSSRLGVVEVRSVTMVWRPVIGGLCGWSPLWFGGLYGQGCCPLSGSS